MTSLRTSNNEYPSSKPTSSDSCLIHIYVLCKQHDFWTETENAVKRAYLETDEKILEKALVLGRGGSTAVTAILIDGQKLVVGNVGDSRAVICENGKARQLSVDHEPSKEKKSIERRGGFVSNIPGKTNFLRFCNTVQHVHMLKWI